MSIFAQRLSETYHGGRSPETPVSVNGWPLSGIFYQVIEVASLMASAATGREPPCGTGKNLALLDHRPRRRVTFIPFGKSKPME